MSYKKLFPTIYLKGRDAYSERECVKKLTDEITSTELCIKYSENGADMILIYDMSYDDETHEQNIGIMREICKAVDIPVFATGNIRRSEDVKKYLYAGCKCAVLEALKESNLAMMTEVTNRFGKDKVGILITGNAGEEVLNLINENKTEHIIADRRINSIDKQLYIDDRFCKDTIVSDWCAGVTSPEMAESDYDYMSLKNSLSEEGIEVNTFRSSIPFSEFKTDANGLIPVVVQEFATDEVLMVAYMNEESYNLTLKTGRMTYYSRSRNEIWVKGLTSGHYQYVISLDIDCDKDTILAKVRQVGAACHTGAHSCFYTNLVRKEITQTNPLKVLNSVMDVIKDRKINPKEGSYTNYLFDKGIDKILKKVGEEATEIVIAAKNPDPVEVKYEISDFLYHVMVLMVERGLDWEEIMEELANR